MVSAEPVSDLFMTIRDTGQVVRCSNCSTGVELGFNG